MKTLNFYSIDSVDELAWPKEREMLSLHSPALDFFTDFEETDPLIIEASVSALEAKRLMQKTHVRLKFILDENDQFIGIISAEDLADRKLVQQVSQGQTREHIPVTEMMTPKHKLKALDYAEVTRAKIGEVISALKDNGEQHCLVVDHSNHTIRGIFSASDISRKLHLEINIQNKSSFLNVFSATS